MGGDQVRFRARLLQCFAGLGHFHLFEAICYQNGDAAAL
jgi:hypothetical protein